MNGYICPVEGCDYTADQIDQLRGHVNASADHPSWGDLDAGRELVDRNDQGENSPSERGKSPDEDGDDDQQNDQGDQADTDMPTDDELQRQRDVQGAQADESGSDEKGSKKPISTNRDTPSKGAESPGLLPAIDTSTILMLLAVLAVALILYRLVSGGGDGERSGEDEVDIDDQEDDGLDNFDATELEEIE